MANIYEKLKRKQLLESGAYDGRYMTKYVKSKKEKQRDKRVKIKYNNMEN